MDEIKTKNKKWCVYIHTNKYNNKSYIGITNQQANERWGSNGHNYLRKTKQGEYQQPAMARALKKYPDWDNDWEHIIFMDNLSEEKAKHMEILLIALYKTNCCKYKRPSYGYNMTDGGEGTTGRCCSDKTRKKISISNTGKPSHNKGKCLPDEVKKKISKSHQGKTMSIEARKKMSESKQQLSQKARENMSNAHDKIPILQFTMDGCLVEEYNSITEASRQTGIHKGSICATCKNKHKSAGGFIWKYKSEYDLHEKIVYKNKCKRPVIQLDKNSNFICEYESVEEASRLTNVNSSSIHNCCFGRTKTAGGFKWKHKEDN